MKPKQYTYNIQHVCFRCRKVFKVEYRVAKQRRVAWLSQRITGAKPSREVKDPSHFCPQCGGLLELMGRAFKAPKINDRDGWRRVQMLVNAGFCFVGYNSGSYPYSLWELRKFIVVKRRKPKFRIA